MCPNKLLNGIELSMVIVYHTDISMEGKKSD